MVDKYSWSLLSVFPEGFSIKQIFMVIRYEKEGHLEDKKKSILHTKSKGVHNTQRKATQNTKSRKIHDTKRKETTSTKSTETPNT